MPLALEDLRPTQFKVPKFPTVPVSFTDLPAEGRIYSASTFTPVPFASRRAASAGGQAAHTATIAAVVNKLCRGRFI